MKILQTLTSLLDANNFNSDFASFLLPFQEIDPERVKVLEALKDFENMIVIGIGGSNLGTIAVSEALAKNTNGKRLYFLDTPDTEATEDILSEVSTKLSHGEKVVITVISKSGSTAETIALADRVYALHATYEEQVAIVTISDLGSKLDELSKNEGWHQLNLPKMVGGRYSVLSDVGLFPLEFIGIDTGELIGGAQFAIKEFLQDIENHASTHIATGLKASYEEGRNIYEHWFFSKKLESMGRWYRQLLAESIGKVRPDGTTVGITPSTALGTIDLHSIAQLDLAHTGDRSIHLVSLNIIDTKAVGNSPFTSIIPDLPGKTHGEIMEAARVGFKIALESKGVPVYETILRDNNAYDIGYWLESKMLEVALLGELMGVNPFDQPNVEDYKKEMKKVLV